ncbi:zinc-binding dehydrogenase, partial [Kibdelosporangium lantanae]
VDFAAVVGDVDVVLDALGGEYTTRSLPTLREDGILVSIKPRGQEHLAHQAKALGVRAVALLVEHDQAGMRAIADLVDQGKLRPIIAETFPLAEAAKAHALGESGHVTGKLVLTVAAR